MKKIEEENKHDIKWVKNIGQELIKSVTVTVNGEEIATYMSCKYCKEQLPDYVFYNIYEPDACYNCEMKSLSYKEA